MAQLDVWVGSGPPSRRHWRKNDVVVDTDGVFWKCTATGNPGTWTAMSTAEGVQSVVAGDNVDVDNTDPANPIVSATSGASVSLLKKVHVAFADMPNDGDSITLWTPGDSGFAAVGDFLINAWADPDSYVTAKHGVTDQYAAQVIGQALSGGPPATHGQWIDMGPINGNWMDFIYSSHNGDFWGSFFGGSTANVAAKILTADPVICRQSNQSDPVETVDGGGMDCYFLTMAAPA